MRRVARRRARARVRRVVLGLLLALAVSAVTGVAWAGYTYWSLSQQIRPTGSEAEKVRAALTQRAEPRAPEEPVWVLLLGTDARPDGTSERADTIIVARLDAATRQVTLLSIPRDTRVTIPGRGSEKINAVTAFGGTADMIRAVRTLTGLPVDHYVQLDFEGFKSAVDALGGIDLVIDEPIDDLRAANYDRMAARIDVGAQTLDGARALTFVRSREFPDGDYTRMRNQQYFMTEFARQALSAEKLPRLPAVASSLAENLATDLTIREMLDLARLFGGVTADDITSYTVPSQPGRIGGVSFVLPDEAALRRLAAAIKAGEPFDQDAAGNALAGVDIRVINATRISGVARGVAARLEQAGFPIDEVGNAEPADHATDMVFYREPRHSEAARIIADQLGSWPATAASPGVAGYGGDVVVLIRFVHGPTKGAQALAR